MIIKETTVLQFTMQYLLQTHDLTVLNEYYDSQYETDSHNSISDYHKPQWLTIFTGRVVK